MIIDLSIAGLIVLMILLGYFTGFTIQLIRIAAIIGAYLLAIPTGSLVAAFLARYLSMSPVVLSVICTVVCGLIIYIVLSVIASQLVKRLRDKSDTFSRIDHQLGAVAGGLKGLIVGYIALTALVFMVPSLSSALPQLPLEARQSVLTRFASKNNLIAKLKFPKFRAITKLALILSNRSAQKRAMQDPAFKRLIANPKARFLAEPKIIQAILEKNYLTLVEDGRVFDLIDDPRFQRDLDAITLDTI